MRHASAAYYPLHKRQNSPYTSSGSFNGSQLAELIYQAFEFQQIRHSEKRTILAYDDLRVGSNEIRPLRRNRADRDIIDPEQETSSITVVSFPDASEFSAAERMERMRDAHKAHCCDRSTCTLD